MEQELYTINALQDRAKGLMLLNSALFSLTKSKEFFSDKYHFKYDYIIQQINELSADIHAHPEPHTFQE
jgi:hypothetical protein